MAGRTVYKKTTKTTTTRRKRISPPNPGKGMWNKIKAGAQGIAGEVQKRKDAKTKARQKATRSRIAARKRKQSGAGGG